MVPSAINLPLSAKAHVRTRKILCVLDTVAMCQVFFPLMTSAFSC